MILKKNKKIQDIKLKNKLELFYTTTMITLIPLFIIFSIQYFIIYQLRNISLQELVLVMIFEMILLLIYSYSKIHQDKLLSNISINIKELQTFSFLEDIDSKNLEDENIYNDLIKFWNNFNSSDFQIKNYIIKVEMFHIALLCVLLFFMDYIIFLITVLSLTFYYILYKSSIKQRVNNNKFLFNSIGKLSVFIEEYINNKLDRIIFSCHFY